MTQRTVDPSQASEGLKPKILTAYQRLPANQRKVADFILKKPNTLAFLTTDSLSEELNISKATIVRFAQNLGYDGFTDLQKEVVDAVQSSISLVDPFTVSLESVDPDETLTIVAQHEVQNISQTIQYVDRRVFNSAVDILLNALRVYTMGVGVSALLSELLSYELNQVAVNAQPLRSGITRFVERLVFAAKGDVVVGFSFPPYSKETVEAAAYVHQRGLKVIAITDKLTAPITFHADCVLAVRTENMLYTNSISAISVVINALVTEIALKNKNAVTKMLKESSRILQQTDQYVSEGSV